MKHRFIHIPKCGGTSVSKFLKDNGIDILRGLNAKCVGKHKLASIFKREESIKFTVVRDPFTRVVSFYNYTAKKRYNCTFSEFLHHHLHKNEILPQVLWIYNPIQKRPGDRYTVKEICEGLDYGYPIVTKIFKLELIHELKEYFNIPVTSAFPKENVSTPDKYKSYYTPELKDIVYKHFEYDFIKLGYQL